MATRTCHATHSDTSQVRLDGDNAGVTAGGSIDPSASGRIQHQQGGLNVGVRSTRPSEFLQIEPQLQLHRLNERVVSKRLARRLIESLYCKSGKSSMSVSCA